MKKLLYLVSLFVVSLLMANTVYSNYGDYSSSRYNKQYYASSNNQQQKNYCQITQDSDYRYIKSNGIPNHSTGDFPNRNCPNAISAQNYDYKVPLNPKKAKKVTYYGFQSFGIATNGVVLDPLAAEFWNNDRNSGWNYNALSDQINLGTDGNNAHVQPSGAYHYHGIPEEYFASLIPLDGHYLFGYAADGFPIYIKFGYQDSNNSNSQIIALTTSYRVKNGQRESGPYGFYDGTFVEDYEYVKGLGDLDECNGREGITPEFPEGIYYYLLTEDFPYIPRCFRGKADLSFARKHKGSGPMGSGGRGGRRGHPGGGRGY